MDALASWFFSSLIFFLILYLVISQAIKRGINESNLGKLIENKYGIKEDGKETYFDRDLDTDHHGKE